MTPPQNLEPDNDEKDLTEEDLQILREREELRAFYLAMCQKEFERLDRIIDGVSVK